MQSHLPGNNDNNQEIRLSKYPLRQMDAKASAQVQCRENEARLVAKLDCTEAGQSDERKAEDEADTDELQKPMSTRESIDSPQVAQLAIKTVNTDNNNNACEGVSSPAPGRDSMQAIHDERERLLWVTKKHVKQMMEEAVTKKFIHEDSSSIISLCVAIEACLSHGLKRRALGLFKTNSSAALIQKLAKTCPSAQEALDQVELEERRLQTDLSRQQDRNRNNNADRQICVSEPNANAKSNNTYALSSTDPNNQPRTPFFGTQNNNSLHHCSSNSTTIHRRNIWIKVALIERKLVPIIDHLAESAAKYYEKDALMSNKVYAQILSSLLVGPCALEFSRSKTNDYYQYEEPSADELLRRHQLSFPIACLCSQQQTNDLKDLSPHGPLARPATDNQNSINLVNNNNSMSQSSPMQSLRQVSDDNSSSIKQATNEHNHAANKQNSYTTPRASSPIGPQSTLNRKESQRKRPLALKSNVKTGALVTDCHHYSCQEISEHQHTRGYSFRCTSSAMLSAIFTNNNSNNPSTGVNSSRQVVTANHNSSGNNPLQSTLRTTLDNSVTAATAAVVAQEWSLWSPRMLHETLHQNSKSRLLYAKNNVLLETQQAETIAGYLSLHQTNNDLILKWIPNQMINGSQRPSSNCRCQCSDSILCECVPSVQSNGPSTGLVTTMTSSDFLPRDDHLTKPSVSRRNSSANSITGDNKQEQMVALVSSYLDLVVNISVSRIVLMHCHFGSTTFQQQNIGESDSNPYQQQQQLQDIDANATCPSIEDTLILVEADGVQRAPFKFPKGGLRWFLSCLESGLRPDKYLEPAIRPDDLSGFPDPLQELNSTDSTITSNGSDSPSVVSEPTGGRLDMLLRRLPSLKRGFRQKNLRNNSQESTHSNHNAEPIISGRSLDSSSQSQMLQSSNKLPKLSSNNYVYRIVSVNQDWPLQTPPYSTSSTCSSLVSKSAGCRQSESQPSRGQKFRWSLSRLTKFSNIYSNTASTNSSSSVACGPMSEGYHNVDNDNNRSASLTGRSTVENTSQTDTNTTHGDSFDVNNMTDVRENANRLFKRSKTDNSQNYIRVEAKLNNLKKSTSEEIAALRTQSIQTLCESMRKQILSRAFYGWLVYYRRAKIIRNHLAKLIKTGAGCHLLDCESDNYKLACNGLTWSTWTELKKQRDEMDESELSCRVNQFVYYGGIECDELRAEVWPYLLKHYKYKDTDEIKANKDRSIRNIYEACDKEWTKVQTVVKKRDNEILMANIARAGSKMPPEQPVDVKMIRRSSIDADSAATSCSGSQSDIAELSLEASFDEVTDQLNDSADNNLDTGSKEIIQNEGIGDDDYRSDTNNTLRLRRAKQNGKARPRRRRRRARLESTGSVGSDASITDRYGNNIHRIDKDVQRCDRNFHYFKDTKNLDKLRNIMCTYVWQHLDVGYVQGMCDLAAPFLVIFDNEVMAFTCFSQLMKRMVSNFPQGSAMDQHFESLKYLMQILDPKLFEVLQCDGDHSHFYFCYRWLLLDFKRELVYADVYRVWETIWSARHIVTENFVVFVALAMVRYYRDIIIENNMDFTDTIRFFNEMAERHDASKILSLARDCVVEVENLIRTVVADDQD